MPLREMHADKLNAPLDEHLIEARLQEAYERGRLQGIAEAVGARSAGEEAERLATSERIATLLERIAHQTSQYMCGLEQEAYRFALAVAERIVKREITLDDSVVMRQVRDAIHRIIGVETITIRVHPDDETLVRSHRPALLSSSDSVREISVEGDDTVERGGCILASATGNVDARIGSQLRQIESALFGIQIPPQESIG
jgi:flagellar assembly protein FliH